MMELRKKRYKFIYINAKGPAVVNDNYKLMNGNEISV